MTTENTVSSILITGTADNDSVLNFGDDVTIDSGSGNDTIYSGLDDQKADRVSINAGEGDNIVSVQGGSDSVTVRTGDGNNMIVTTCPNNAVFSGAGKDSVTFYTGSDNNTVDSGDGDDVIDAVGHNVTINAGAGNDRIRTYRNAYDISIKAGTGDDDITLGGPVDTDHTNVVQYADGDGNDTISTFSATDTLQITSGNISGAELVGNNVVITVGSGTITLVEANNMNINILDADGKLNQTIFSGGSSEDTVINDTLIAGTDGDDYLINDSGKNVTISALNGNDTIENTGDSSIIDAGEGDNMVSVAGAAFVTVTTGDGSNTIYSDSNGASGRFRFGDGNNSIITSNRYSTIIGGSGGNGITLHNGAFGSYAEAGSSDDTVAVGHYDITVDGGAGNDLINLYRDAENSVIIMGTGNDTVAVYNNKHAQTFQYSGGNDLITGFDADDTLRIAGSTSSSSIMSGDNIIFDFGDGTITLAGVSSAESLNVEYLGRWTTIDGGFIYSGHTTNNYTVTADVSLIGSNLKDNDGDGAPDNVTVGVFKSNVVGVAAVMRGLSGEVTLNNKAVGVIGDDNYEDHFIAKVRDGTPDSIVAFGEMRELRGISDGATVNPNASDMIAFDKNAKVHLGDVENVSLHNKNYMVDGSAHAQIGIANNGAGADLTVEDGILTGISGLGDGYSISLVSNNNVSNELTFQTDGGAGEIVIGGETLSVGGESNFTVELDDDGNIIKNKWATIDSGFVYSGHATNNYAKTADVSLIGSDLKDEDGDGAPDNVTVSAYNYSSVMGVMAVMEGLSGEVTLNNKAVGVFGDDNYEDHFTAKVIDNASAAVKAYAETKEVRGISDGATVNPNASDMIAFDENAKAHVGDVTKFFIYNKNHKAGGSPHAQIGIANNGAGADLTVENDILTEISGLENDYSFTVTSSDNVSNELTFQTDGMNGTINVGDTALEVNGDAEFSITFDDDGNIADLKNFDGSSILITNAGGLSTTMTGGDDDDLLAAGTAVNTTMTGGAGSDTFRGGASLESALITDYTEGEDVIYHGRPFADLSINGSIEGNDYIFHAGSKTITVQDGADKIIEVVDVNGESRFFGKCLTLDDNDPATVTAQDGVATIDAALRTEDIQIIGTGGDNTIISGAGNATLTGSNGSDLFVYNAGEDVISDYATGDKISIGAAISGATVDGADIVITTDGGSLRVQNAKGKTLSLIDSAGETVSTLIGGGGLPAQVIDDLTGIDVDNLEEIAVTNAEELAALKEEETSLLEISGNQNVDLSKFDNAQIVSLGSGRQTVKFNDKDDNIAVVDENARGRKNIVFGKGNYLGIFNSENANVSVDLSKAGNTTIAPYAGSVTLEGYKDASILIPDVEDIVGAVMENAVEFDSDKIKIGSATVKFDSAANSRLINFVTEEGDEQKVGFVRGGVLNLGNDRGNYLIKGEADSTITAGAGNDTILAGEGNKIDAGAGRNQIYLDGEGNSTVVMRNGKATVENFNAGFEDGDRLFFGVNDTVDFKFDGNDVKVYNNGSLRGVLSNVADGADFVNILTADDNSAPKIVVAQKGAVITVENEIADYYTGKKSGVDFSNYEETLAINLGSEEQNLGTGEVLFTGINQITVGSGLNTLIGSSANETLTGNGITEFNFRAGGGRDLIQNFNFDEDKINVSDAVTDVRIIGEGNVRLQVGGGDDYLTIEDAQGKHFSINGFTAKVDRNIDFDDTANYFVATGRNAVLTVGDDVEGDAIVWLDNPARNGFVFKGDIKTLDASGATVKAELAGNNLDNTIQAGLDDASLWGGNGGNDLLIGGAGKNIFFYTNGNDTIAGANDGDEIILSGVTLEQIAGTNITADGVAIDFKDGGALQVNSNSNVTYRLADGTKFSANHENLSWESK